MSDAGRQSPDGGERRRRTWSADRKQQIIAESLAPGVSVAAVARRHGLNANMLFSWRRREQRGGDANGVGEPVNIVPVKIFETMPTATAPSAGAMGRMEIVLAGGERIIVGPDVDATALAKVVKALTRR